MNTCVYSFPILILFMSYSTCQSLRNMTDISTIVKHSYSVLDIKILPLFDSSLRMVLATNNLIIGGTQGGGNICILRTDSHCCTQKST